MTLGEKFKTGEEFIAYVENSFGIAVVDTKVKTFYEQNLNTRFTYTGILKAVEAL
jgi:hypothetical protein